MNLKVNEFLNSAGIAYNKTNQRDRAKRELDYHILKIKNTPNYRKEEVINNLKPKVYDLLDKERKMVVDKKSKEHISELETEIVILKKELGRYKEKSKLVARKKDLQKDIIKSSKTKIKVVKIDKEEVKKLQLQIIRLEKICEILERSKKSKKLELIKLKLKKIERKLRKIKLLK